MKFLICGLGSIGQRHLNNLFFLGEDDIIAYRKRGLPLTGIKRKIASYDKLESALIQKPDVALITNPTAYHIPLALRLANHGCHLFIEKPLSSSWEGVNQLKRICRKKNLSVFIGFMMRYHPAIRKIKKWLTQGTIGLPLSARVNCGQYLPSWHPAENYCQSYAAKRILGGGPINTLCHDIDLLSWFFGPLKLVFSLANKSSSLKTSTEQNVEIILGFKNKIIAEVHLDYLQIPPKRIWEIIGSKGRIEFNYYKNLLILYQTDQTKLKYKKTALDFSSQFTRNDMFTSEMKEFIQNLKNKEDPEINLTDGITNLKILIATHQSIKQKRVVNINQAVL